MAIGLQTGNGLGNNVTPGRVVPPTLPGLNSEANAVAPMSRFLNEPPRLPGSTAGHTPPLFQPHHVAQLIERLAEPGLSAAARAEGWALVHQLRQAISSRRSRKPRVDKPAERVTLAHAAAILGLKHRKLQGMAQRGEILGAAKFGRQWTFDLAGLRRLVTQQENVTKCRGNERPRPEPTGAAKSSLAALKSAGGFSDGCLAQMIRRSQKRVAKQGKREH
jgi:hypothetical protein